MIGRKIIYKDTLESTNNYAANLHSEGKIEHGTVILAGNQTAGKGQRGAQWDSEPYKNLAFTCFLQHDNLAVQQHFYLNQVISLACAAFLNSTHPGFSIKWPNDLVYNTAKAGGILVENQLGGEHINSSIIGIGINLNQTDFGSYNATSLQLLTGKSYDINESALLLCGQLNFWYNELKLGKLDKIRASYLEHLWLLNTVSRFRDDKGEFEGIITGTDESGQLLVQRETGIQAYQNKEITFLERYLA
ncbi:MAG: biotin--[acetyl-CoA-carboxylase] ligase [Bacteroidota bacterium]